MLLWVKRPIVPPFDHDDATWSRNVQALWVCGGGRLGHRREELPHTTSSESIWIGSQPMHVWSLWAPEKGRKKEQEDLASPTNNILRDAEANAGVIRIVTSLALCWPKVPATFHDKSHQ
ncbi:hypothetical protein DMENIID0001_140630 [Sergentomyia squamirostris]